MKVYRELTVEGSADSLQRFFEELDHAVQPPWSRNRTAALGLELLSPPDTWRCYERAADAELLPARLWFFYEGADRAMVKDILPLVEGDLTAPQYNALLTEFLHHFVEPAASRTGVRVECTPGEADLAEWLSPEAARLLRRFSLNASRGTAASLPADRQRWLEFLLVAHRERERFPAPLLRQWLIEEEHWPEALAETLAGEYDIAGEVLEFAEQHALAA